MKKSSLNPNNPLTKYQRALSVKNVGRGRNNWKIVSDLSGLHLQTIISIARLDYEGVLRMSLRTYLMLRDNLGVDMLSFDKD